MHILNHLRSDKKPWKRWVGDGEGKGKGGEGAILAAVKLSTFSYDAIHISEIQ